MTYFEFLPKINLNAFNTYMLSIGYTPTFTDYLLANLFVYVVVYFIINLIFKTFTSKEFK